MTFGEFIRRKRLEEGYSLREFCKQLEIDASNWSKVERGKLPAPEDKEYLESIAKFLSVKKSSSEWNTMFDLASISRKKIPDDVFNNKDFISVLLVFFRTIRGDKPTRKELEAMTKLIKDNV
jgi:transcriptional regulator with XRE-family HTH domain